MNRNKVLTTLLAIITLGFIGLMALLIRQPSSNVINQTVNPKTKIEAPKNLINLRLSPETVETSTNQTFSVLLTFENVKSPISAADLILKYDPTLLQYIDTASIESTYLNPRNISDNGKLIVSFVDEGTSSQTGNVRMAELVFKALKPGQSKLVPTIDTSANSSMAIVSGSQENQLTSVNEVSVNIK